jgi:hypothetical protein
MEREVVQPLHGTNNPITQCINPLYKYFNEVIPVITYVPIVRCTLPTSKFRRFRNLDS